MRQRDYDKEDGDTLRQVGFTDREIKQLRLLRTGYLEQEVYRKTSASAPPRHAGWFERIIRKTWDIYRRPTISKNRSWTGD